MQQGLDKGSQGLNNPSLSLSEKILHKSFISLFRFVCESSEYQGNLMDVNTEKK